MEKDKGMLNNPETADSPENISSPEKHEMSETWAHDCIQELDDWIESQGIYIRQ